ncbi:MAG: hypothetical protein NUV91_04375 [Candidatus Omnitrophica bacterium]|nr:hypothetical protein [Candidatus Omnitrophota bacterium]
MKDIIELDTSDLNGKVFDWRHYGGPLAILKLSNFVRFEILKDVRKNPSKRALPQPKNHYIQQGGLILKKIKEIPKGVKRAKIKKSNMIDLGGEHKLLIQRQK